MKKIIIIIFLLSKSYLFAQLGSLGGHDSLLFDGEEDFSEVVLNTEIMPEKNCKWKVKFVWGTVIGTRDEIVKLPVECPQLKKEGIGQYLSQVRKPMKIGDEVYDNDLFEMDDKSFIQLEMSWGGEGNIPFQMVILTMNSKSYRVPSCPKSVLGGINGSFIESRIQNSNGKVINRITR